MSPLSLPEHYVGLSDTQPHQLIEHAEQVQRNFEAVQRAVPEQGSFPVLPSRQKMMLVTGSVTNTGTISIAGTGGWTVARTGGAPVGDYTITFARAFSPTAQVPVFTPIVALVVVQWLASTATTIRYTTTISTTGVLADAFVSFHVLGPVA